MSKYIDLADAMEATRDDWSEGFWRVGDALARFAADPEPSATDVEIIADIARCMSSDDGRVFRDTTWNYDRLREYATTR